MAAVGRTAEQSLYADFVLPHHRAPSRHTLVDVAMAAPETVAALRHTPSSEVRGGVAAELRVLKKHAKYGVACAAMGARFVAGVMEIYGACSARCSDDLVGFVRGLCGEGDRDREAAD